MAGWFTELMPVPSKVTAPPVPAANVPEPVEVAGDVHRRGVVDRAVVGHGREAVALARGERAGEVQGRARVDGQRRSAPRTKLSVCAPPDW